MSPESAWPEGYHGYEVGRGAPAPDHPPTPVEREPADVGPEAPKPQVGEE